MIRRLAALSAIAAVLALGVAVPPVLAASHAAHRPAVPAAVARQVAGLLKYNPGAVQISPYAVRYKGAIMGVAPPARRGSASPNSASNVCPNDNLCLFWDADFSHIQSDPYYIQFSRCDVNYDLYNYSVGGGHTWADEVSSIDYPGSNNGYEAKFNHDGDWWLYLYRDHYLKDLVNNGGPNPRHNSNDWITGLYAC